MVSGKLLVAALAAALCFVACGEDDPPGGDASPATAGFPVTIENELGSAEVRERPERVVALGGTDADIAVALGVTPVVVPKYPYGSGRDAPWLAEAIGSGEIEEVDADQPSLERIAAARPDVILASSFYGIDGLYDKLTAIAPVVAYEAGTTRDTWQTQTLRVGRALGRQQEARALVADVEARLAATRADHPALADATFSFSFHHAPGQIVTLTSGEDFAVRIINGLGLTLAPEVEALDAAAGEQVSFEQLRVLDADAVLIGFASDELRGQLEANAVFRRVPAVRDGRYIAVDLDAMTALRNPSVLSIPYGIDAIVPELARAAERMLATETRTR